MLADEVNRATPKAQSALLEAMEEHQVTADGSTYPLAAPQHTAHYLTHPRQARRDFAEARWKIGFLQRAVPLPLPYGKLYLKLKK